MDFVEARKPAGSNLSNQDKSRTFLSADFPGHKTQEMGRSDAGARQRSHSRIRSVRYRNLGEKLGPAARQRRQPPCRESRRRNQGCGLVWLGCPVNSNRAIMGGYVVRPDSVIVPFNCQGRASCTPDCFPSGYRMRDALIPDKSESE